MARPNWTLALSPQAGQGGVTAAAAAELKSGSLLLCSHRGPDEGGVGRGGSGMVLRARELPKPHSTLLKSPGSPGRELPEGPELPSATKNKSQGATS